MSKNNEINITQDKNFGDIYLEMKWSTWKTKKNY
jgi:chromatin segregation and condensation protein Rec8/ScpA/Scc1 (kleisin family)